MQKWKVGGYLFSILTALAVFVLSVIPAEVASGTSIVSIPGMDKLIHGVMYAGLAAVFHMEYFRFRKPRFLSVLTLVLVIWGYSILMEVIQWLLVDSRMGEIPDALANLAGIIFASGLYLSFRKEKN